MKLTSYPHLVKEWHPTNNKDLKPDSFTHGSNVWVWWKCPQGYDHEWEASINSRSSGNGCPFCSGHRVSKSNNLLDLNPKLANDWHPTKNKDLKPENFTLFSNKQVWWQCSKVDDHEWKTSISNRRRSRGGGCPFCAGKKVSKSNNLLARNPEVASEWHPTKNKNLKPEDFTYGSGKKVWWQCPKVDDHEWEACITDRSRGTRCPFCAGKRTLNLDLFIS